VSASPPADPDHTGAGPAAHQGACPPGSRHALLPGVRSRVVRTPRLATHVYESGTPGDEPIVLIHGNASSARFFEELMAALPDYYVVAPDLRGYGASETLVVDARRGVRDYADDVHALVETLGLGAFHLLGWSLGGCVAMRYAIDHPDRLRSLTLQAPGSPYGYGGTHGPEGRPNYDDWAGSGGGLISPEVRARYSQRDAGADSPFSPRNGLRRLYVKPPFRFAPEREDALVEQMLLMVIGDQYYPGDATPSPHWPFTAPGVYGSNNAVSPKYCDLSPLAVVRGGPPILWVRGADDQVVQDGAMADPAQLGKLGIIPGWPGDAVCPPQPMVAQTRAVLERYAANGGGYREEVFADCGHSPHLEHPERFRALFADFVGAAGARPAAGVTPTEGGKRPPAGGPPAAVPPRRGGLLRRLFGRR
jgi:pimeloyl-ACP methyl ester carboxylesterase